jgi:predicted nuclease of predicted toxin-antitoxin system
VRLRGAGYATHEILAQRYGNFFCVFLQTGNVSNKFLLSLWIAHIQSLETFLSSLEISLFICWLLVEETFFSAKVV